MGLNSTAQPDPVRALSGPAQPGPFLLYPSQPGPFSVFHIAARPGPARQFMLYDKFKLQSPMSLLSNCNWQLLSCFNYC